MATKKTAKGYFIVNPAGAIHSVSYEHAKDRLRKPGWRMATKAEVAKLNQRDGNQVHDDPIVEPWKPEPEEIELPEELEAGEKKDAAK
jgi:hypothetical protein